MGKSSKTALTGLFRAGKMTAGMRVSVYRLPALLATAFMLAAMPAYCGDSPAVADASKPSATKTVPEKPAPKRSDALKKVESDLFEPFQGMKSGSSLDAKLVSPSEQNPAAIQAMREESLRKRDWVFMDPDELLDDTLNPSKAKKKSAMDPDDPMAHLSPLEQYYSKLFNNDKASTKPKNGKSDPFRDPFETTPDENSRDRKLSPSIAEEQRKLDELAFRTSGQTNGSGAVKNNNGFFADVFGLSAYAQTREEKKVEQARIEEFKELIGAAPGQQAVADSFSPIPGLPDALQRSSSPVANLPSLSTSSKPSANLDTPFGTAAGVPKVGILEDQNTRALTIPGVTPAPKVEAPKSYFPTTPSFNAPRRAF
jgi:hypothetical protein